MTHILRLTQSSSSQGKHQVRIELLKEREFTQSADVSFDFNLSFQDQERLRWYFEDYLQYPQDPAPNIARQVEQRLSEIGIELFDKIFRSNFDVYKIWSYALPQLNDTRIEIVTDVREATTIPWELLCNPDTLQPLALSAASFMRTYSQAAVPPKFKKTSKGPIRILLAICRPARDEDVPFRSVASRVISGLSKEGNSRFQLDVLRPPTFEELGRVLRKAKAEGKPYHVFHFDGHGTYGELNISAGFGRLSRDTLAGQRVGPCGYLLFENPLQVENMEPVDGTRLGNLLRETEVPILVLNACRSAYAESPNEPAFAKDAEQMDAHSRVRAFGSLAQEVMHSGTSGVVAMRYVVYVVTAAQFVAELYDALVQGMTLEEAVNLSRKHLYDQPKREIAFREHELQDWSVPVVFGAGTLSLFSRQKGEKKFEIKIRENEAIPDRGYLDQSLPPSPDAGFFGRDETLQAIDRAIDSHKIVLLHAYAGNGKTATAAEFARWYSLTGGVNGPVLFTSFERYMPLPRVLDKIGQIFGRILEKQGIHWLTLDDDQRKNVALQVLEHFPVLWIWDNIEPIAGFPIGMESAWSIQEQKDLVDFLRAAQNTLAKFLLTSRRGEREWLGDLPCRVPVPPMPMFERVEMARAIADKQGHRMVDIESWKSLLRYTEGNPLTIAVLVGQVLRASLSTREQIEMFVNQLRAGEIKIEDDVLLGRSRSLGASLSYGFQHAFDDSERRILALLQFFQGFVNMRVLSIMGLGPWALVEMLEFDRTALIILLDKAADVGLLTALGRGYYRIHPALPWYFLKLFQHFYGGRENEAVIAFVSSVAASGNYFQQQYCTGHVGTILILAAEDANLLYALQLALKESRWAEAVALMQGLRALYDQTGRWAEWKRLIEKIVPFYVDLKTNDPIPGRDEEWGIVTDYRIGIAQRSLQMDEALMLQKKLIEWMRKNVEPIMAMDPETLDEKDRIEIESYIGSIHNLALIQQQTDDPMCIQNYTDALEKFEKYGFGHKAAGICMNLGSAYMKLAEIRNLDRAEKLYKRGQELFGESDNIGQSKCLVFLGQLAIERFLDAQKIGEFRKEHLEASWKFYQQALKTFPSNATNELASTHNSLGNVNRYAGRCNEAMGHFQEAIRFADRLGDVYWAAQYRLNAALNLADAGRLSDSLEYARSALEKFQACGPTAAEDIQKAQNLIANLEKGLRSD